MLLTESGTCTAVAILINFSNESKTVEELYAKMSRELFQDPINLTTVKSHQALVLCLGNKKRKRLSISMKPNEMYKATPTDEEVKRISVLHNVHAPQNNSGTVSEATDKRKQQKTTHTPMESAACASSNSQQPQEAEPEATAEVIQKNITPPQKCGSNMSVDCYIQHLFRASHGKTPATKTALSIEDFFLLPTEEHLSMYSTDVIYAVQDENIEALEKLPTSILRSCNRFGESILHMACRRGLTKVVKFLLSDESQSIRVRDDYGRTPLHDACWNRHPKPEIIDMLLKREPALLLVTDKRGFTPFQYARREHWSFWRQFLYERHTYLDLKCNKLLSTFGMLPSSIPSGEPSS